MHDDAVLEPTYCGVTLVFDLGFKGRLPCHRGYTV